MVLIRAFLTLRLARCGLFSAALNWPRFVLARLVLPCLVLSCLVLSCLVVVGAFFVSPVLASERVISHPHQQLALFGYDPVAYFADGEARLGSAEHETLHGRLVWRFSNAGNLQAFLEAPDRFIPAYGGHGALQVARGAIADGHPQVWLELGGRIFLFRDAASRYAFLLEADSLLVRADTQWPELRETLAP